MNKKINNYINHVVFCVDMSSSMSYLKDQTIKVFDEQIKRLAAKSKVLDQETRVSIYLFSDSVKCVIYDMDVLRLPSLKDIYAPNGMTALIAATGIALEELGQTAELHGEHAFLLYTLTDGMENTSHTLGWAPEKLKRAVSKLPDHWTMATFVPDEDGKRYAINCGFPEQNIAVWTTDGAGMDEVADYIAKSTDFFMEQREKGVRGHKALFAFDVSALDKKTVKSTLNVMPNSKVKKFQVRKKEEGEAIRDFVERRTKKPYKQGNAYYQLSKKERVQSKKNVCLMEEGSGKVYTGEAVRPLLGLPNHEVKVNPADHPDYLFFVQSTSWNRKLVAGTQVLVVE